MGLHVSLNKTQLLFFKPNSVLFFSLSLNHYSRVFSYTYCEYSICKDKIKSSTHTHILFFTNNSRPAKSKIEILGDKPIETVKPQPTWGWKL